MSIFKGSSVRRDQTRVYDVNMYNKRAFFGLSARLITRRSRSSAGSARSALRWHPNHPPPNPNTFSVDPKASAVVLTPRFRVSLLTSAGAATSAYVYSDEF